jgi:hypothetical protein
MGYTFTGLTFIDFSIPIGYATIQTANGDVADFCHNLAEFRQMTNV